MVPIVHDPPTASDQNSPVTAPAEDVPDEACAEGFAPNTRMATPEADGPMMVPAIDVSDEAHASVASYDTSVLAFEADPIESCVRACAHDNPLPSPEEDAVVPDITVCSPCPETPVPMVESDVGVTAIPPASDPSVNEIAIGGNNTNIALTSEKSSVAQSPSFATDNAREPSTDAAAGEQVAAAPPQRVSRARKSQDLVDGMASTFSPRKRREVKVTERGQDLA